MKKYYSSKCSFLMIFWLIESKVNRLREGFLKNQVDHFFDLLRF
jgi:hypothetical protein